MALSTQSAVLAKRRALNYQFRKPFSRRIVKVLFETLAQHKGNPDLQIVEFDNLAAQDTVIADAACKVYGIVLTKDTATAAYFKGADHATTAPTTGGGEIMQELNAANDEVVLAYPDGFALGSGLTVTSHTSAGGATESSAGDGPRGFVILGGA